MGRGWRLSLGLALLCGCSRASDTPTRPDATSAATPADSGASTTASSAQDHALGCTGPIGKGDTFASIERRYGKSAVREMLAGPEGEDYEALVLWPKDPERRIELVAGDDPDGRIVSATIAEGSRWQIDGIGPGAGLAQLTERNGRPFRLYGFEWDYGGLVSDWREGSLGKRADGCFLAVQLSPRDGADLPRAVLGDGEIASDLPALRSLGVHVARMTLNYPE